MRYMKNVYRMVDDNVVEMQLTQDQVCLFDVADMELVGQYQWFAHKKSGNSKKYYVHCTLPPIDGKQKTLLLHRLLMGATDKKIQVDHMNGDSLNNCRGNLRLATNAQNICNRPVPKHSGTGIKDIGLRKDNNKYRLRIVVNGIRKTYGQFDTQEEAIIERNKLLPMLHGEFANITDRVIDKQP